MTSEDLVDLKPRGRFYGEPVGFELLLKVMD